MTSRSLIGAVLVLLAACGRDSTAPCSGAVQVRLAPAETTLALGTSFVASLSLSACGGSQSVCDVVTWRSEDIAVAVVNTDGQVTGKSVGATRILATGQRYGALGRLDLLVYNPVNPTDAEARAELRYYIERVRQAAARRYRTYDDVGHTMDGLKIIANPDVGGFIGVYQTYREGTFDAHLATSTDLLNIRTGAGSISFGNPTIEQVEIGGHRALVMTLFVFLDGSVANENGSLVYYRTLPGE